MACTAEILIHPGTNATGKVILAALAESGEEAGVKTRIREHYYGDSQWLVMWGIGADHRSALRYQHISRGGFVQLWDIGYFKREKVRGYVKASINDDYATKWLDRTEPSPERWAELGLTLRNDFNPKGHIILAGIGPKQRMYMGMKSDHTCWEYRKFAELKERFPGRRIIYRPKPNRISPQLPCETNGHSDIADLLKGAALIVCLHSNVAVDAVLAGVPFESEDGVSTWLRGKPYTKEVRLDFCQRLARWQYKAPETAKAWTFMRGLVGI